MIKEESTPLIVIVGMSGSGKSVVADYLKENGWRCIHFGKLTTKIMEKKIYQ